MKEFESRKASHLTWALSPASQTDHVAEWQRVRLTHQSLPELDFSDIRLNSRFLKTQLATPFFISGMTAGHPGANDLNLTLAHACEKRGWIFCVGSQRRELESQDDQTDVWEKLRGRHPDLLVVGNLGASQLVGTPIKRILEMLKRLDPQALAIHLNPLQESLQSEGTPQFKGVIQALRNFRKAAPQIPLLIKETGSGFSRRALQSLSKIDGLTAVDVSGLGGTHWGRIEGLRAHENGDELRAQAAGAFADWGITTIDSVN
ncbi:MAG: type 2 isopentenyl-diphosphate Delta-isomerase, partial [Proteobacteria bacterium]